MLYRFIKSIFNAWEKEYGEENPYLTYKILDINEPLSNQEIEIGGYDIVLAANVLHATKNIRVTLRNAKALLKKNGIILLNEIAGKSVFMHLTFGLLEGWWMYEDCDLRISGSPGLYPEMWQKAMLWEGFGSIVYPMEEVHDLGQQIIIAKSNGITRQKIVEKSVENIAVIKNEKKFEYEAYPLELSAEKPKNMQLNDQTVKDHIKGIIIEKLSESLKMDMSLVNSDKPFSDYGVDSIIGVQLVQVINQTLKIEIETTSLFDYSTVNQLTEHILLKYKGDISKLLGQRQIPYTEREESQSERNAENIPYKFLINSEKPKKMQLNDLVVKDHIKGTIIEKLSESLKMDMNLVNSDKPFSDYGVDSIIGVQLVQVINQTLKTEIETTSLFDYSTVNQLTEYILSKYKKDFSGLLGKGQQQDFEKEEAQAGVFEDEEKNIDYSFTNRFMRKKVVIVVNDREDNNYTGDPRQRIPIAIIGMSGRFAKSETINKLWKNLSKGRNLVDKISRWDLSKHHAEFFNDSKNFCNYGSLLDNIDQFDPSFFNISGLEATYMEPQQRIMLEEAGRHWKMPVMLGIKIIGGHAVFIWAVSVVIISS